MTVTPNAERIRLTNVMILHGYKNIQDIWLIFLLRLSHTRSIMKFFNVACTYKIRRNWYKSAALAFGKKRILYDLCMNSQFSFDLCSWCHNNDTLFVITNVTIVIGALLWLVTAISYHILQDYYTAAKLNKIMWIFDGTSSHQGPNLGDAMYLILYTKACITKQLDAFNL